MLLIKRAANTAGWQYIMNSLVYVSFVVFLLLFICIHDMGSPAIKDYACVMYRPYNIGYGYLQTLYRIREHRNRNVNLIVSCNSKPYTHYLSLLVLKYRHWSL